MLSLIFAKARSYAALITAGVIAALYAVIKYLSYQREIAEERAERAETAILRKADMDAIEKEVDNDTDSRTKSIAERIEAGEAVDLTRWPDE